MTLNAQTIAAALVLMGFLSRLLGASDHDDRKLKIQELEQSTPSAEAVDRKDRSIAFLKSKGVPTISHLPAIEDSNSANIRTPSKIAERLIACTICAVGGESGDQALVNRLVADFDASGLLSIKEKEFLRGGINNQQSRIQFSWRYERSWVLLWALGYIEKLDYPPSICDVPRLVTAIRGKSVSQLVRDAKPKSAREILDEADLIYRLDWAVVDERVNKSIVVPNEVERGVVVERHAALNWLIGYLGQEWDDISTDT